MAVAGMQEQPLLNPAAIARSPVEVNPLQEVVRFLRTVRCRKWVVVTALVVGCLLGGLYYAATPRVYESRASLLVLQTGAENWTAGMSGERMVQDLMPTYQNMFTSEEVLEATIALLSPEDRVDFKDAPRSQWLKILQSNLTVSAVQKANILDVVYRSKDPRAAAAVVDSLLSAYLAFMDRLHKSTAREILDILTKEKRALEEQLRAKEAELLATRGQAGELVIRDGDKGISVVVKRAISLSDSLMQAHGKRLEAQSQLSAIEAAIRNGEDLQQHVFAMADSVGREVLLQRLGLSSSDSYTISRMHQQLLESEAKLHAESQLYGPAHRKVRETQEKVRVAEEYLRNRRQTESAELREISDQELAPMLIQMARQQFQQSVEHENSVRASYEEEKRRAIELDRGMAELDILELDLNRLRGFYDVVLERIKDIDLGEESGMVRTSVLSRPKVPLSPVWPHLITVGLFASMIGLAAGLAVVYVQDRLEDHFRSPEELRQQLGIPVLAMVQEFEPLPGAGVDALHVHARPKAAESEAFRTLRTALSFTQDGVRSLVVSSSEPGDGKTTVAANLATAYAQSGKRTLLIDADMRRPGLTPLLDLWGPRGLSAVLRQQTPIAEAIAANLQPSVLENLDVLPSGPRAANPAELLSAQRFQELLAWAETSYDQILIDSPPALIADTAIIGRQADGVLLVVQPEKNPRRLVMRVAETFSTLQITVLGIVANRLSRDNGKGYYGYGYGYGYSYSYGDDHDETNQREQLKRPSRRRQEKAA